MLVRCVGYQLVSMGLNATQIDGRRVILVTDFNQTITGLPLKMTELHTTVDDSTPVPIPAGQPAPPLPPAMQDMVPPVVVAAPPALAFNLTTMQPTTLAMTFTLTSANPMRWLLTLIDDPLATHQDVTRGPPPGLTVTPDGGAWNSSPLTVTVTMTPLSWRPDAGQASLLYDGRQPKRAVRLRRSHTDRKLEETTHAKLRYATFSESVGNFRCR